MLKILYSSKDIKSLITHGDKHFCFMLPDAQKITQTLKHFCAFSSFPIMHNFSESSNIVHGKFSLSAYNNLEADKTR